MDKACALRPVTVFLALEQAEIIGRKQAAFHAAQPARERPDRNADIGFGRPDIDVFASLERRHAELLDLLSERLSDSGEQTGFFNRLAAAFLPAVGRQRDDRQAGKVDECPRPVGPKDL